MTNLGGGNLSLGEFSTEKLVREAEEKRRLDRAIIIANRAIKYIMGYLNDYNIDVRKDFQSNPIEITIRIYWKFEGE